MEKLVTTLSNKNILVTGGTGFLGSHLCEELLRLGARVTSTYFTKKTSAYFYHRKLDKKTTVVRLDIRKLRSIKQLIHDTGSEYIFHLAAQPLVETAYNDPYITFETNTMGTLNVLEAARNDPNIKGIIISSSDKAYGDLLGKKYNEQHPLASKNPYDVSKSAADFIILSYFHTYKLPVAIARCANIYGEGDSHKSRIIPSIIESVLTDQKLMIRSDGSYTRDYLYVKDAVTGFIHLAEKINEVKGQVFNFGSFENLTVIKLIHIIEKILGKKIDYHILNTAKGEILNQALEFERARRTLGWQPQFRLENTIRHIYNWYKRG